jgi:hypothetical protein
MKVGYTSDGARLATLQDHDMSCERCTFQGHI